MLRDICHVIAFEFSTLRSSARIWLGSGLFLALGLISAMIYSFIVREATNKATELVQQNGGSLMSGTSVSQSLSELYGPAVLWIIKNITDCGSSLAEPDSCSNAAVLASSCDQTVCQMYNELVEVPPLILASFWLLIGIMPWLIILLSFDIVTNDIQYRTVSFPLLRISRPSWYLGKLLTYLLLLWGLTFILLLTILITGNLVLPSFNTGTALLFSLKIFLLLFPYILTYLALVAICSSLVRSPFAALLFSTAVMFGLGILKLLAGWDFNGISSYIFNFISYLLPASYQNALWAPGILGFFKGFLIYLVFGGVLTAGGILLLKKRDL